MASFFQFFTLDSSIREELNFAAIILSILYIGFTPPLSAVPGSPALLSILYIGFTSSGSGSTTTPSTLSILYIGFLQASSKAIVNTVMSLIFQFFTLDSKFRVKTVNDLLKKPFNSLHWILSSRISTIYGVVWHNALSILYIGFLWLFIRGFFLSFMVFQFFTLDSFIPFHAASSTRGPTWLSILYIGFPVRDSADGGGRPVLSFNSLHWIRKPVLATASAP